MMRIATVWFPWPVALQAETQFPDVGGGLLLVSCLPQSNGWKISRLNWGPIHTECGTRTQIGMFFLWCCLHAVWTPPFTSIGPICLHCVAHRVPRPVWIGPEKSGAARQGSSFRLETFLGWPKCSKSVLCFLRCETISKRVDWCGWGGGGPCSTEVSSTKQWPENKSDWTEEIRSTQKALCSMFCCSLNTRQISHPTLHFCLKIMH